MRGLLCVAALAISISRSVSIAEDRGLYGLWDELADLSRRLMAPPLSFVIRSLHLPILITRHYYPLSIICHGPLDPGHCYDMRRDGSQRPNLVP